MDRQTEPMEGIEAASAEAQVSPLLTEDEKRILELYDRLEQLQLEIALLEVQGVLSKDELVEVSEEDISKAQQELLTAKASYQVRSHVTESVLTANPILKAVHSGEKASIIERDLLPLIQQRDDLSISLNGLSTKVFSKRNELQKVESEHVVIAKQNVELAKKMLALAKEVKTHKTENIDDPKLRQKLDDLEAEMKSSRQKWRIMKGTASATIAGSGVDWARDPKLVKIVLDNEGAED